MTEELKQKFDKLYKKRRNFYESHTNMAEKIGRENWQKNEMFQYYKKGATEATKELQAQIEQLVYLHNEDVNTIKLLNKQIEKLHNCWNCKKCFNKSCPFGKKLEAQKKKCKEWEYADN